MSFRLRRIETYVLLHTLSAVAAATAVISTVILLIDFVEISRTVGVRAEIGFNQILGLTLLQTPSLILILLPFAFLFGVLGAFVNLNRRSELIALRAAGVSAWRFIFPAAIAAAVIGAAGSTVLNPITSAMSARFEKVRDDLMQDSLPAGPKEVWLRQGDSQTQVVIRARAGDDDNGVLRLSRVSLFISQNDSDHGLKFSRRIEAAQARLLPGHWLLTGAQDATPGALAQRYDTLEIPSTLDGRTALERFASPAAVSFWGLWTAIARTEQAGFSATGYRLQLQDLLAAPLLYAAMSILAAAFSLRLIRLGGLAQLAGSGVALGFVLFFFDQFCNALGRAEAIPPFVAAWSTPILALLSGFTLLCYTEDG
ncbi:MAG TPA: LptF/LptG family permease [Caulobacteraceae bacterium]|nr:LptF/LptG family permease [Caulobacteraceae bacterium]